MLDFDFQMGEKVKEIGCFYRRYADDIGIICEEAQSEKLEKFVMDEIEKLNLHIQSQKTQKYKYTQGMLSKLDTTN